jgi:hypothetical protein
MRIRRLEREALEQERLHHEEQQRLAMAELDKEIDYSAAVLKTAREEIAAAMATPEGRRDIRNMLAFANFEMFRSVGTG